MDSALPTDLVQSVLKRCPCRVAQIRQIATFYNIAFPSPPIVVTYGIDVVSKLEVITAVLEARQIKYALVKSRDCLSQRHLLSKIFSSCIDALGEAESITEYEKVDNINSLVVNLQRLKARREEKLVLVVDGIDRQKGAGPTLIPALARLGDQVPDFPVLFTSSSPRPLVIHRTGVQYVPFPPYTPQEAIYMVTTSPTALYPTPLPNPEQVIDHEALSKIYAQFVVTIYDTLIVATASTSISTFRSTCEKLWPRFIWPFFSGEKPPAKSNGWDFSKLLVRNRGIFQADGENALVDRLGPKYRSVTFKDLMDENATNPQTQDSKSAKQKAIDIPKVTDLSKANQEKPPLLKQFSTLLLVSAYLASHTNPKYDMVLFSRLSSSSSKRMRKLSQKKKLSLPTPKAASSNVDPAKAAEKAARSIFDPKMGLARPFPLERLVAILRAVHPEGVPNRRRVSDRIYRELGEMERLRLVVRAGGYAMDDPDEKWKVNVSRDWVVDTAKTWDIGVEDYEMVHDS